MASERPEVLSLPLSSAITHPRPMARDKNGGNRGALATFG
jgi:hypothetical protein